MVAFWEEIKIDELIAHAITRSEFQFGLGACHLRSTVHGAPETAAAALGTAHGVRLRIESRRMGSWQ